MLAGPLDYHSGGFRSVRPEEYKAINIGPVVMGTRAHQMAMYVVYENPLPMICDYPAAYEGEEETEFLSRVPTTWDETRFVDGQVGDFITIARRKGNAWYVGSMTGDDARERSIPLSFLGDGQYVAEIWTDDPAAGPNATQQETRQVTATDTIPAAMAPAGGQVIRLVPVSDAP
jgi:alpha-glucosidase